MISFLVKYKNIFLFLTIAFFLGSLGFVGAGVFMEEYGPNAAIAKVGSSRVTYKDFETSYKIAETQARENLDENTPEVPATLKQEVLQALINEESLSQTACKYGLGVSDLEVGYAIKSSFSAGDMFNKNSYIWVVRNQFGMNPSQYEAMVKKQKMAAKFQNMLILSAKVPQQEIDFLYKKDPKAKTTDQENEVMALAALQIKAQSLMNSFTDDFNTKQTVEITAADFQ